jgi:nitrogen regulatory protein PII
MCISSAAYKAIVVSEVKGTGAQQGSCKDGQKEYTDSSGGKTCIGVDFVTDILKYF